MIELALAKQQARIDGNGEDELLAVLLQAAVEDCAAYLNRPLYADEAAKAEAEKKGERGGLVINAAVRAAILQLFAYLYAEREGGGMPESVRRLLDSYRTLPGA